MRPTRRDQRLQYLRKTISKAGVILRIANLFAGTIVGMTNHRLLDRSTGIFHDAANLTWPAAEMHAGTPAGNGQPEIKW